MAEIATSVFSVESLKTANAETAAQVKGEAGMLVPPAAIGATPEATVQAVAPAPGVERWRVKTGTDKDIGKIKLVTGIVDTTVEELQKAARPKGMPDPSKRYPAFENARATPVETTVWRLKCRITAVKLEADGDYHLVLQGSSGETIVGEVPFPADAFVAPTSPFRADIKVARDAVDKKILKQLAGTAFIPMGKYLVPPESTTVPSTDGVTLAAALDSGSGGPNTFAAGLTFKTAIAPVNVRVTGVGFFDNVHGQMGVAPNGIELHPILHIEFLP